MEITINGRKYKFEVRSWWGPLYTFEDIMDVPAHLERKFNPASTLHLHVMLYCVLMNDNEALDLTLDEFIEALNNIELCNALTSFYLKRVDILTTGRHVSDQQSGNGSKKKSSRRTTSMRG